MFCCIKLSPIFMNPPQKSCVLPHFPSPLVLQQFYQLPLHCPHPGCIKGMNHLVPLSFALTENELRSKHPKGRDKKKQFKQRITRCSPQTPWLYLPPASPLLEQAAEVSYSNTRIGSNSEINRHKGHFTLHSSLTIQLK